MKIRIQNDGKPAYSTTVTDVETGKQLEYVTRVDLTIDVHDQLPQALLTMVTPVVDVIADAEIRHVCPICGKPAETPPTRKTQSQAVIEMVKQWENEQQTEREQAERVRQIKMLVRGALYDATACHDSHGDINDERIDMITDDVLQSLKNL